MEENNEGRAIDYTNAWGGINLADGRVVTPDGKGGLEVKTISPNPNPITASPGTGEVLWDSAATMKRLTNISRHPWVKAAYAHRESPDVISNIYTALVTLQQAAHGDVEWGTTPPAEKDAPTPTEEEDSVLTGGDLLPDIYGQKEIERLRDENASLRAAIDAAADAYCGEGHEFDQEAVADALLPWVSDHLKADLAVFATGGGK